jgi:hypothetical protein
MERSHLRKLNNAEVRGQFHVKISRRFAALGNLDENVDRHQSSLGKY